MSAVSFLAEARGKEGGLGTRGTTRGQSAIWW